VIPNDGGHMLDPETGEPVPGQYVTGWIKRGPSGVIGTNKKDANETVAMLVEDLAGGRLPEPEESDPEAIVNLLHERGVEPVSQAGWEEIDRHERETGEPHGRPRVKLAHLEKLLERSRGGAGVSS
jgi:ferredoxin--NADP+ reductase